MTAVDDEPDATGSDGPTGAPVRMKLDITGTDEIVAAFEAMYGMDDVRFDEAPSRWSVRSVAEARTSLARIEVGGAVRMHSAPVEGIFVVHVERGAYQPILDGQDRTFGTGEVFSLPPGQSWIAASPGMVENVLFLPPGQIAAVAGDAGVDLLPRLTSRSAAANPARFGPLRMLWSEMASVLTRAELYESPLAFESAYRSLVMSVLSAFDVIGEPVAPKISPGTVRRAVDVMRARMAEPLTVGEIAQDLQVSVRTLQAAFRSTLSMTPLEYLRRLRLEAVRDELLAAERGQVRVGDLARRFGFVHLGRFAGEYHRAFGELPIDSLRRR